MLRACGFGHESAPRPQQSAYSLQDHLELEAMRHELLESRLALAGPMLETQRKKLGGLTKQVSDVRVCCGLNNSALVHFRCFRCSSNCQVHLSIFYTWYIR